MPIGFRIYSKFERANKEVIEMFKNLPVANIADNMGRLYSVDQSIKPFNKVGMLGPAFTVKLPSGDNLMFHKAIELAQEGDILVISAEGCMTRSLCGGLMFNAAMKKGIRGFLIDGCIRDVEDLKDLDFACYAKGVQPNGPYKNGPGEIGVPVAIANQVVHPGDIIVGDMDGVVVVPKKDAEAVAKAAKAQNELEKIKLEKTLAGKADRAWIDEELKKKNCEIINGCY